MDPLESISIPLCLPCVLHKDELPMLIISLPDHLAVYEESMPDLYFVFLFFLFFYNPESVVEHGYRT